MSTSPYDIQIDSASSRNFSVAQADSTSCFQKWTTGTKGIIVKVLVLLILAIIFFVIGYAVGYSIHRCKEECVTCPTIPYTTTVSP
ncbi:uncharacterized protein LOC143465371 [Clavelina lepadiformis]|uniref:Uncharacterized protein n=1 Tax=Clavelina lepadiformis TaxID=159417 RepID=A0ABP0F1W6_CLALP